MSPHTRDGPGRVFYLLVLSLCLHQAHSGVSVGAAAGGAAHVLFGGKGGRGGEPRERDEDTEALIILLVAATAGGIREGCNVENSQFVSLYFPMETEFFLILYIIIRLLVWLYSGTVSTS